MNKIEAIIQPHKLEEVKEALKAAGVDGMTVIDARGKTLLPGFVMVHEHLFYPTGTRIYGSMPYTFPRLYLAGGTMPGTLGIRGIIGKSQGGARNGPPVTGNFRPGSVQGAPREIVEMWLTRLIQRPVDEAQKQVLAIING